MSSQRLLISVIGLTFAFAIEAANPKIECESVNPLADAHRVELYINEKLRLRCHAPNMTVIAADFYLQYENVTISADNGMLSEPIDGTSIELTVQFHRPIRTTIAVWYQNQTTQFDTDVVVDSAPEFPPNIDCIQYGNRLINCSLPIRPHLTILNASFRWSHVRESKDYNWTICPEEWPFHFSFPVDSFYEQYSLHINLTNFNGTTNKEYAFRPSDAFVPDRPHLTQPTQFTERSAHFQWTTVESMQTLLNGMDLHYDLRYSPSASSHDIVRLSDNDIIQTDHDYTANLHNLQPYTNYTVSLHSFVGNKTQYSSEASVINFRTAVGKPSQSPQLVAGSFLRDNNTEILIFYWTEIEPAERNGPSVSYNVWASGLDCMQLSAVRGQCIRTDKFTENQAIDIEVRSASHNGLLQADTKSRLPIPPFGQRLPEPEQLAMIVGYNGTQLFWKPPMAGVNITSYTVLWGMDKEHGEDDEKIVEVDAGIETLWVPTSDQRLFFKVAANSASSSSGLVRMDKTCRMNQKDHPDPTAFRTPVRTESTNATIEMVTKCLGYFHNLSISYCLADETCPTNRSVNYAQLGSYPITGLAKDTTYQFAVFGQLRSTGLWVPVLAKTKFSTRKEPSATWLALQLSSILIAVGCALALVRYWLQRIRREKDLQPELPIGLPVDRPVKPGSQAHSNSSEDKDDENQRRGNNRVCSVHLSPLEAVDTLGCPEHTLPRGNPLNTQNGGRYESLAEFKQKCVQKPTLNTLKTLAEDTLLSENSLITQFDEAHNSGSNSRAGDCLQGVNPPQSDQKRYSGGKGRYKSLAEFKQKYARNSTLKSMFGANNKNNVDLMKVNNIILDSERNRENSTMPNNAFVTSNGYLTPGYLFHRRINNSYN